MPRVRSSQVPRVDNLARRLKRTGFKLSVGISCPSGAPASFEWLTFLNETPGL
jgi:hypothetical protein